MKKDENESLSVPDPLDMIMGVEEAARLWGYENPDSVKRLCREGKVKAVKIGKTWVLDRNQPNPAQPDHPKNWRKKKAQSSQS